MIKLLIFLFLFQTAYAAKSLIISNPTKSSSGCNLHIANFNTKQEFFDFFKLLQNAAKSKDKTDFLNLVLFPLNTHLIGVKGRVSIKTKKELKKNLSEIFSDNILQVISNQKISTLFCNYQGVMLGNGEVWIGKYKEKIGIKTIN